MRISDWSSDVCSSDLLAELVRLHRATITRCAMDENVGLRPLGCLVQNLAATPARIDGLAAKQCVAVGAAADDRDLGEPADPAFVGDFGHRRCYGAAGEPISSEERRVGNEGVRTFR